MPETVKRCINCGRIIAEEELICLSCGSENEMQTFSTHIITNADRIRAMTDEELAELFDNIGEEGACALCQYNEPYSYICRRKNSECMTGIYEYLKKGAEP